MNEDITQFLETDESEDTQRDKFLSFKIAKEDYAIEIQFVNEIFGIQKITEVPNIQKYIKGIINLRGMIVPVIDVRLRFNLPELPYDDKTCIIVLSYDEHPVGLIVDEVHEVLNIAQTEISPSPQTNKGNQSRFIQGIGKVGEDIKIILNIKKVLFDDDKTLFE